MNLAGTKNIFKMLGGSHSYGLNTPTSDTDYRGVYLSTYRPYILGLSAGNDECRCSTEGSGLDESYTELRAFLRLLRGGNTQALEAVFSDQFLSIEPEFQEVRKHREHLVDSEKLIKVLKGYAQSEKKLANGERTGKLGGKRKGQIEKYGFSPKNFVQLFRLLWAGRVFYSIGVFPVRVSDFNKEFSDYLLHVKTQPQDFTVGHLNAYADELEAKLDAVYAVTQVKTTFNEQLADQLCWDAYRPLLV